MKDFIKLIISLLIGLFIIFISIPLIIKINQWFPINSDSQFIESILLFLYFLFIVSISTIYILLFQILYILFGEINRKLNWLKNNVQTN